MWIDYKLIKYCPMCGFILEEEHIEDYGIKVKRKMCTNPKCFFMYSKNYGPIIIDVDEELIISIPKIPHVPEEE